MSDDVIRSFSKPEVAAGVKVQEEVDVDDEDNPEDEFLLLLVKR